MDKPISVQDRTLNSIISKLEGLAFSGGTLELSASRGWANQGTIYLHPKRSNEVLACIAYDFQDHSATLRVYNNLDADANPARDGDKFWVKYVNGLAEAVDGAVASAIKKAGETREAARAKRQAAFKAKEAAGA